VSPSIGRTPYATSSDAKLTRIITLLDDSAGMIYSYKMSYDILRP